MENRLVKKVSEFYFIAIAVLMYYFLTEEIQIGIFISFRHAFALVLAVSAILMFLIKPNIARGYSVLMPSLVYFLPLVITIIVSLFIWFVGQVDTVYISRGLSAVFVYTNMISCTLAAAAFLYIFGEKGIWYNLISILIANMLMIATIVMQYGIGPFLSEFITLIVTFAGTTGDIIVQAEIHELAFCLGAYLIYMLLKPKRNIVFFILLGLTVFCFVAAFKRIGIIAIAIALSFGWLLRFVAKFKKDTAMRLCVILASILVLLLIGYVWIIKLGVFTLIEEAGIETSGRVEIYNAVDKFYEFSPEFLGNGIGYLAYQLSTNINLDVTAVHNDFLQYFIDLGFWGFILWLTAMTLIRVCYYGRKGRIDNAIITLSLIIYLVIVSSTDNTMNFPLLTTVLAIIMMGHGFDQDVRNNEIKIFGHVSDTNKQSERESIL